MEVAVPQSIRISVHDQSQVGEARREAAHFAGGLGLGEETLGRLSIAVTEAGRNLYLHGGGGELILNRLECTKPSCLELLAIDKGKGMQDVSQCMRDGYSTAGTPGNGLGAVSRLADSFDIYSSLGSGTVLMARFLARRAAHAQRVEPQDCSVTAIAHSGEIISGDAWASASTSNSETFLLADGLGHGQFAADAAGESVRIFRQSQSEKPAEIIERAHGALRSTRGAALAIARIQRDQQKLVFAGIGNISALIIKDGASRNLVSLNGTVGHQVHKVQEFVYPWTSDALLIMHSDGLNTRWDLNTYPGLARRSPGVIAGILYRDFSRGRDDVTVLVARSKQG